MLLAVKRQGAATARELLHAAGQAAHLFVHLPHLLTLILQLPGEISQHPERGRHLRLACRRVEGRRRRHDPGASPRTISSVVDGGNFSLRIRAPLVVEGDADVPCGVQAVPHRRHSPITRIRPVDDGVAREAEEGHVRVRSPAGATQVDQLLALNGDDRQRAPDVEPLQEHAGVDRYGLAHLGDRGLALARRPIVSHVQIAADAPLHHGVVVLQADTELL
mmetsp:Transcript_67864/g.196377  ORF Transcript_67864/g.196377 Transcript_67864/m.196377 type:complete len:220 (+) Transcript_67864:450-1109(+)